jgi:hypothetical protein
MHARVEQWFRGSTLTVLLAAAWAAPLAASAAAGLGAPDSSGSAAPEVAVTRAAGTFEVKLNPEGEPEAARLDRMSIDKQFHGDLEATSRGEMISVRTEVQGSAGYVALERVSGTLHGRSGSFVLQHSGTMTRGVPELSVTVVPDSGTGELIGIIGKMAIIIADGKHSYELDYTLPAAAAP